MNTKYNYNLKTSILTTTSEQGSIQQLNPTSRDTWGNPIYNLGVEKSNWIQFAKWTREKGETTQHDIIRGFLKEITSDDIRQINTYYAQEQKIEDKKDNYLFIFEAKDEVFKNNKGNWAYKFKQGNPEL